MRGWGTSDNMSLRETYSRWGRVHVVRVGNQRVIVTCEPSKWSLVHDNRLHEAREKNSFCGRFGLKSTDLILEQKCWKPKIGHFLKYFNGALSHSFVKKTLFGFSCTTPHDIPSRLNKPCFEDFGYQKYQDYFSVFQKETRWKRLQTRNWCKQLNECFAGVPSDCDHMSELHHLVYCPVPN